jgi:hypothetical protein
MLPYLLKFNFLLYRLNIYYGKRLERTRQEDNG